MAAPKTRRRTPLDDRLDEVLKLRGLDEDKWTELAGLSVGYIKQARHRATHKPSWILFEKGGIRLAEAVGVNVEWLRFGRGPRDAGGLVASPLVVREPKTSELALVTAYVADAQRLDGRDFLAALDLLRAGEQMLPPGREGAVAGMRKLLRAVSRARRDGRPITFETLAGELLADDANAEGVAELAALGAEPPREPVRTPPRGVQAVVPKTVGNKGK